MNIQKFTQKSMEAVQNCEKLAYEYGNQQIDELHDVQNPGHVVHDDPPGRQQRGAEDLQRFVLGPLRGDLAVKAVPAFDLKICHNP